MEFTVVKVFDSEEELIKCEDFKPLELRQDIIGEEIPPVTTIIPVTTPVEVKPVVEEVKPDTEEKT